MFPKTVCFVRTYRNNFSLSSPRRLRLESFTLFGPGNSEKFYDTEHDFLSHPKRAHGINEGSRFDMYIDVHTELMPKIVERTCA